MPPESRPLILVVEDDPGVATLQRRRLERSNFRVEVAADIDAAIGTLERGGVALALVDYRLGNTSALDLQRRITAEGYDVPVIVVSGAMDDAAVVQAMRAGVRDVVLKSTQYLDHLPDAVRAVLSQAVLSPDWPSAERPGGCVLIVEDDIGVATLQKRRLERAGYDVAVATSEEEALAIVTKGKIGLMVLDLRLHGSISGLDLYERFKLGGWNIPAILVTAFPDQSVAVRALRAGIRDFVPKSSDYLEYLPTAVDRVTTQVQIERKLVESELRFASIIGTTMDAILMCNEQLRIILFNKSAEEMFECAASEAMLRTLEDFIPDFRLQIDPAVASDSSGALRSRQEFNGVSRRGNPIPIEVSVSEVVVHGNRFFTVIARDVSERRRTEAQFREADRRKDEFLATLAHELRNPLAALSAAAHLLAKASHKPQVLQLAREALQRQVAHMAHLLDALLDVARITHGRVHITAEHILLGDCVDAALEAVKPALEAKHHRLSVAFPDRSLRLTADRVRVTQILVNLLTNAIKYTDAGGQIGLSVQGGANEVVVSVRDSGIGIPPEDLNRVFEMFSQSKPSLHRSEGGLGIGLSLVRSLVRLHGGSVTAHSEGMGKGSEFVVRLPRASVDASTEHPYQSPNEKPPEVKSRRILVADDNVDSATSWAALLEVSGHIVRVAHNGRDALAAAEEFQPEVAMIDIGMPELSGLEVAQAIRRSESGTRMLLIAVSGWGQPQDKQDALDAGFDLHLTKPVGHDEIERILLDFQLATVTE